MGRQLYLKSALLRLIEGNELNAAYAADGYARVKGLSALITTFGSTTAFQFPNDDRCWGAFSD
jgi:TPP-dependent 2-oxoacid decarboxylase